MFKEAIDLIEARLFDNWVTTPIDWDNVEYTPIIGTSFIRLQVEWTDSNAVSIGGRARGDGYIDISIFVPANTGSSQIADLADSLSTLYNRWDTGQLRFKIARTIRVGMQHNWYQLKVIIPFTYEECN